MIGGEKKTNELLIVQSDLAAKQIKEEIIPIIDPVNDQLENAHVKAYIACKLYVSP